MRRRGTQVLAGLFTAGMIAVTGLAGAQSVVGVCSVETIERKMESNLVDSALSKSGNAKEIGTTTKFKSLDAVVKSLNSDEGYTYTKVAGYSGDVLVVAHRRDGHGMFDPEDGYYETTCATFYTENKSGTVINAGTLYSGGPMYPIAITKDGVVYASSNYTYETYMLSSDGSELVHKDYVQVTYGDGESFWGYFRPGNTSAGETKFKGGERDFVALYDSIDTKTIKVKKAN